MTAEGATRGPDPGRDCFRVVALMKEPGIPRPVGAEELPERRVATEKVSTTRLQDQGKKDIETK